MRASRLVLLTVFLCAVSGALALNVHTPFSVFVRPLENTSLTPNSVYHYDFIFAATHDCDVLLNASADITTDKYGVGYTDLNISNLTQLPAYLCEYRNDTLRTITTLDQNRFKDINDNVSAILLANGSIRFTYSNGSQSYTGNVSGKKGDTGNTGATGPTGPAGTNGTDGVNGADGATGAAGQNGSAGVNGTAGTNATANWTLAHAGNATLIGQGYTVNVTSGAGIAQSISCTGTTCNITTASTITQYTDSQAISACYNALGNATAVNTTANIKNLGFNITDDYDKRYIQHNGTYTSGDLCEYVPLTGTIVCDVVPVVDTNSGGTLLRVSSPNGSLNIKANATDINATANVTYLAANCALITGSADLCDGVDATGAGASSHPASNITNGSFGSLSGAGNYDFPANLSVNGTLNGTQLTENNNRVCTFANGICVNITSYISNGTFTYTVPTGTKTLYVVLYGAGGGGGSAAATAANTARGGGTGGGGGAKTFGTFNAADLPATLTVNVGNNGTGGAAVTTAAGNGGTAGGPSNVTFGAAILLQAFGGGGGALGALATTAKGGGSGGGGAGPGTNATTSAIAGGFPTTATGAVDGIGTGGASAQGANAIGNTAEYGGAAGGGAGTAAVSSAGGKSQYGGGGGGGGGSNGLGNTTRVPAAGGQGGSGIFDAATTGGGGGAAGGVPTSPNGANGANGNFSFAGSGGGGGAFNITAGAAAGNGGFGGLCGGGGGGSGSGNPTSGTGGNGGNGCAFIIAYG